MEEVHLGDQDYLEALQLQEIINLEDQDQMGEIFQGDQDHPQALQVLETINLEAREQKEDLPQEAGLGDQEQMGGFHLPDQDPLLAPPQQIQEIINLEVLEQMEEMDPRVDQEVLDYLVGLPLGVGVDLQTEILE